VLADVAELVDGGHAADDGPVLDSDMAAELDAVGHNDVVTDRAVVGDMGIGHEQAVAADGAFAVGGGAAVESGEFAHRGVVADLEEALLAAELEVLRQRGDDGAVVDAAVFTDAGAVGGQDARAKSRTLADGDILFDDREGADLHVVADLGAFVDQGCGMDFSQAGSPVQADGILDAVTSPTVLRFCGRRWRP